MGLDSAAYILFLGCVAALHAVSRGRGRVMVLLAASLVFYAASSAQYLVLMLCLAGINYAAILDLGRNLKPRRRTLVFAGVVTVNLAALIFFKYLAGSIGGLLGRMGWVGWVAQDAGVLHLAVPLGISYFTFQMLACLTDVYRETWKPASGFVEFLLFALFFPQISSGPIPRADRLLPQLAGSGNATAEDRLVGIRLIAYGLFKKFVVANRLNDYVSYVFDNPAQFGSIPVVWAIVCNALCLYADFSGYVDIAIGSARVLGIRLDPNFDRPLTSTSVTELWRRWHMSLSFWLRDYLYMPLLIRIRYFGKAGVVFALIFTFCICGIWHAFTWNYFLFGLAQGLALAVEFLTKSWRSKRLKKAPKHWVAVAGNIYTLGFFALAEVLFRATSLQQAQAVYVRLAHLQISGLFGQEYQARPFYVALMVLALGVWAGIDFARGRATQRSTPWFILACALLILFVGHLGTAHFIYATF